MLREITIRAVLNGWIVNVGCQTVVFTDMETMLTEINFYLTRPIAMEEKYKDAVNYEHFRFDENACEAIADEPINHGILRETAYHDRD